MSAVHDENCETTVRRSWRRGGGCVKNAKVAPLPRKQRKRTAAVIGILRKKI